MKKWFSDESALMAVKTIKSIGIAPWESNFGEMWIRHKEVVKKIPNYSFFRITPCVVSAYDSYYCCAILKYLEAKYSFWLKQDF